MTERKLVLFLCGKPAMSDCLWEPMADVYHAGKTWIIKLDLAGVDPNEITIKKEGSSLMVRGVRRDSMLEKESTFYSLEISYSHFSKSFTLPFNLERARIQTEYKHGMLLIRLLEDES
jgi:HSP20 family protein